MKGPWSEIPKDLWYVVMRFMSVKSLSRMRGTCEYLKTLVEQRFSVMSLDVIKQKVHKEPKWILYQKKVKALELPCPNEIMTYPVPCFFCKKHLYRHRFIDETRSWLHCRDPVCFFRDFMDYTHGICICDGKKCFAKYHFKDAFPYLLS